jgi:membrane protease YdiL (CAAX protease family)
MWVAINTSVVVRLLYHLYQGPIGIMTIVPMGLLYGYVYSRTRQLWPLVVAHVLVDLIGLTLGTR